MFFVLVRNSHRFFKQRFQLRLYRRIKFFKRFKRRVSAFFIVYSAGIGAVFSAVFSADFPRPQSENLVQFFIVPVEKHILDGFRGVHVARGGRYLVCPHARFVTAADIRLARFFFRSAVRAHRFRHTRLAHKRKTVFAPPHHVENEIQQFFGRIFVDFQLNFRVVNADFIVRFQNQIR